MLSSQFSTAINFPATTELEICVNVVELNFCDTDSCLRIIFGEGGGGGLLSNCNKNKHCPNNACTFLNSYIKKIGSS